MTNLVPAKTNPAAAEITGRARAVVQPLETRASGEDGDGRFVFAAEISNTRLDSYYTHMALSTLRNFAQGANEGVAFLDSHDGRKLPIGYSLSGTFEEQGEFGRVLAEFYITPGINFGGQHSFASTDDLIRAIKTRVVRDVSVGFYGGRYICDLCHQPYYGGWMDDHYCPHIAGWEYEIEADGQIERVTCTVTIHDSKLSEVSAVFDGATPGAMILKAEQEAAAGRLQPEQVRFVERQYRMKLTSSGFAVPDTERSYDDTPVIVHIHGTNGKADDIEAAVRQALRQGGLTLPRMLTTEEQMMSDTQETREPEIEETEVEEQPTADNNDETPESEDRQPPADEARAIVREVSAALAHSGSPAGTTLADGVRWLTNRVTELEQQAAELQQQRAEALAEAERLRPLADDGRIYRADLIEEAIAEGIRAQGEAFPQETYRTMLAGQSLEGIKRVRDAFAELAGQRFPGGRQTRDDVPDQTPERRSEGSVPEVLANRAYVGS